MKIFLILLCIFACGCDDIITKEKVIKIDKTSNDSVVVDLIFEHDGIKAYRFWNNGHYVYYTDARGITQWEDTERQGKRTIRIPMQNETAK